MSQWLSGEILLSLLVKVKPIRALTTQTKIKLTYNIIHIYVTVTLTGGKIQNKIQKIYDLKVT